MRKVLITMAFMVLPLCAQEIQWPASFQGLAAKAKETINVTLDSSVLGLAGGFLSGKDKDEAQVKELIGNLKGIYVRGFEFENEGAYSKSDLDDIRKQLIGQQWTQIVDVKDTNDIAQVFLKKDGDAVAGLTVVAAEPKELVVVHILGPINLSDLAKLGGNFGIPDMSLDAIPGARGNGK